MAMLWRVRMLGGLTVDGMGQTISRFHTQQAAGALAYLAYHIGQPQAREVLVEQLWPGVPPAKGRDRLNVAISSLRRQLEPAGVPRGSVIQGDRHTLALSAELVSTDVAEFRAAVEAARRASSAEQARPLLETALALHQGVLLPGHYQDWIGLEQELLTDLLVDAARRLTSLEIAQRRPRAALEVAQRAVAVDPLREECHALLLRAAAALGDSALARRHYEGVVELFRRELGGPPSPTLAQLARAVDGALGQVVPELVVPRRPERPGPARGNTTYLGVVGAARQSLSELAQAHRGVVVSSAGPVAVLAFAAARDGWRCAASLLAEPVLLGLVSADVAGADDGEKAVALAERMADAGHRGLVLADQGSASLLRGEQGSEISIHEQGQFRLGGQRPAELLYWLGDAGHEPPVYPAPRAETAAEAHLPPTLSGFYGRETEVEEVGRWLVDGPGLVTITGPGGAGKTRLALEVARCWTARHGRPCWFVPLATLRDAALLPRSIAGVLRGDQADDTDPLGQVVYRLSREPGLLLLDNFEQLPDAAAGIVATLSSRVPEAAFLVTSRRRIGLDGEREYPLSLLATPDPRQSADVVALGRVPSVAMFVDRARAALPTFALSGHNAQAVAELCQRLEGWPLAIELAAPLVQTMPTRAMLERFGGHLDWRATRRSGLPDRQRTLRVTLEWSLALLPAPVRRFGEALCVFAGPFTCAEAQAVLEEPLAELYLGHLRDCSLAERAAVGQEGGYVLRTPVRELMAQAREHGEPDEVRARCARYFGALADGCPQPGATPEAIGAWLDRADQRLVELRLALEWGLDHDPLWALDRACALVPLWELRGHAEEGMRWLERLRAACGELPLMLHGQVAYSQGRLACLVRPHREVVPVLDDAIAVLAQLDDLPNLIGALFYQMVNHLVLGDVARLEGCARLAQDIVTRTGAAPARMLLHNIRSCIAMVQHRFEDCLAESYPAVALAQALGDPVTLLIQLTQQAMMEMIVGDLAAAEATAALLAIDGLGQVQGYWAARISFLLARLALERDDLVEAAARLASAAPAIAGQTSIFGFEWATVAADLAARAGDLPAAAQCAEMARRWRTEFGSSWVMPYHGQSLARVDKLVVGGLESAAISAAVGRAQGATMAQLAAIIESLPASVRRQQAAEE